MSMWDLMSSKLNFLWEFTHLISLGLIYKTSIKTQAIRTAKPILFSSQSSAKEERHSLGSRSSDVSRVWQSLVVFHPNTECAVSGDTRASYKPPAFVSSVKPYVNKSGMKYRKEREIWTHPVHTWLREDLTLSERVTGGKRKGMGERAPFGLHVFLGDGDGKGNKRKTHQ